MERFPGLMQSDAARLLEPLALIYMHFDPQDLEDADALQQMIDTLEPPADLAEAVQDLVRSVMLLADVTRPLPPGPPPPKRPSPTQAALKPGSGPTGRGADVGRCRHGPSFADAVTRGRSHAQRRPAARSAQRRPALVGRGKAPAASYVDYT